MKDVISSIRLYHYQKLEIVIHLRERTTLVEESKNCSGFILLNTLTQRISNFSSQKLDDAFIYLSVLNQFWQYLIFLRIFTFLRFKNILEKNGCFEMSICIYVCTCGYKFWSKILAASINRLKSNQSTEKKFDSYC